MALKGQKQHTDRLRRMSGAEVVRAAGRVLFVGADMIRAEAHRSISAGSVSGKNHVASRPGEPPNRDTGVLQAHIETSMPEPLVAQVTSSAPYAAPLEFSSSKMAARPSIRPARDKMAPTIQRLFTKEMDGLVRRSGR